MAYRQSRSDGFMIVDGLRRKGYSPRNPPVPTIEQLLQEEDAMRYSMHTSPTFGRDSNDMEDDNLSPSHKKSVLAKVKEKARKWRSTLSKKRQNEEDSCGTPSWGVSLDDEEDEDPEYFGAPMYESEMAPEGLKETARQHPRAVPVVSENRVLASCSNVNSTEDNSMEHKEQEKEASLKTISQSAERKEQEKETSHKTIAQSVTEKLTPAYAAASAAAYDVSDTITDKVQRLTLSTPETQVSKEASNTEAATAQNQAVVAPTPVVNSPQANTSERVWDKGVSVKEYLKHKLEPGEDEKALSQVISEAISPRKKNAGEVDEKALGVVEKVKEAMNSFLWNEDSNSKQTTVNQPAVKQRTVNQPAVKQPIVSQSTVKQPIVSQSTVKQPIMNQPIEKRPNVYHSAKSSATNVSMATNYGEVEEESNGRILQAN